MKRFVAILVLLSVTICLCSCDYRGIYDEAYEDGHFDGQCDGYYDGIERAKEYIAFVVDDDLSSLARDLEDQYGIHPEEAVQILSNYADVPDEVSEEELHNAIWAIYRYYYRSNEVINGIEDYDIE